MDEYCEGDAAAHKGVKFISSSADGDSASGPAIVLKNHVILGYCDIGGCGSRALLGIDSRVEYETLKVTDDIDWPSHMKAASTRPGALKPDELDFEPFQILNLKYEDYSLVIINTQLSSKQHHVVLSTLFDLFNQNTIERLIVVSVLRINTLPLSSKSKADIFENCFFSHHTSGYDELPLSSTEITDSFLLTFIQMLNVENIPTNLFTILGHRLPFVAADHDPYSKELIKKTQSLIREVTGLRFSIDVSASLSYCDTRDESVTNSSMMYL